MFYTFQGITRDGRYWIYAVLPLRASGLDLYYYDNREALTDDDGITWEGNQQLSDFATSMADDDFFPTLGELDHVIESLNFYGAEGMSPPVMSPGCRKNYNLDLVVAG